MKAGDLLAQIDPRPYQAQLDQVVAARARDGALLAAAKLDLQRPASTECSERIDSLTCSSVWPASGSARAGAAPSSGHMSCSVWLVNRRSRSVGVAAFDP